MTRRPYDPVMTTHTATTSWRGLSMIVSFNRVMTATALVASALLASACGDDDPVQPVRPPTPPNIAVSATSATAVRITFDAVSGATSYLVQRAAGAGGTYATVGTPTSNSYDDNGLEPNTAYRYRVASVRGSDTSAFSADRSVTTLAAGRAQALLDGANPIAANRTLYADTVYVLKGFVKVAPNVTLTIQPGTKLVA